jgi:hypothetical protein
MQPSLPVQTRVGSDHRGDQSSSSRTFPDGNSKPGTHKRVLRALACPPALVAISVCHTVLAATYWAAFLLTGNGLYAPVALSYSVVTAISWFKVREVYRQVGGFTPSGRRAAVGAESHLTTQAGGPEPSRQAEPGQQTKADGNS